MSLSSRQQRIARILLLTALFQPGWAVAHVLLHHHEGHLHHAPAPAAETPHQALADHAPGDHGHLDDALIISARAPDPAGSPALLSFAPEPAAPAVHLLRAATEGQPPWADPERATPSHPRAPPHA
jgi:hypothetical protein